ncbi:site-specific integrase [Mycolicibacterium mageritense]|uniref:site-specific integrase n=1 Tax=Mycolicibacterium mageritense TaxID=53462 RepID=UPI0011D67FC8|nr:site-specific integrase [Mycolicibacterium mageritense]TXI63304.1 MAG: site-specific integrase [Mycolicibacterium mageritense]GJJ21103.1 site-specific integrase [Mycolicibacterium mageritense]
MATIKRYQTAGGERWEVRYRQPNGITSRKRGFATKKAAEDWDADTKVAINAGSYVSPSKGRVKVGDLATAWLERKKNTTEPSHSRMLESAWRVHVEPVWGAVPVNKVTVTGVKNWSAAMTGAGSSATTVLRALGVLAGILDDAIDSGAIKTKNPARGLDPRKREKPTKPKRKHVYLDHDAVARLSDESGAHRVLVLVLAYCGIRWGEAVALRVRHIDEVRRRLLVIDNAVQLGADHAVGDPKDDEPREVPVPKFLMAELKKQIHGRGPDDLVFGDGTNYLPRPKSRDGWFAGAVKRAKVQRITPHDLRHTAASLAISAGANVLAVSRMLGHENPQVTLRTYADLFDTDLDAVSDALDTARRKSVSKRGPRRVQRLVANTL